MQTLTEIVAAVVVHSSAAAYSHFGVTLDTHQAPPASPAERTVARTQAPTAQAPTAPAPTVIVPAAVAAKKSTRLSAPAQKTADCPQARARVVRT